MWLTWAPRPREWFDCVGIMKIFPEQGSKCWPPILPLCWFLLLMLMLSIQNWANYLSELSIIYPWNRIHWNSTHNPVGSTDMDSSWEDWGLAEWRFLRLNGSGTYRIFGIACWDNNLKVYTRLIFPAWSSLPHAVCGSFYTASKDVDG